MLRLKDGMIYKNSDVVKIKIDDIYKDNFKDYYCSINLRDNPYGSKDRRMSLGEDIVKHGQIEPIALWKKRGMVHLIDGRNRLDGSKMVDAEWIYAVYLPTNSTKAELQGYIDATRNRVNADKTQLAIEAFRRTINDEPGKMTQKEASKYFVTTVKSIESCGFIYRYNPLDLDKLFDRADYRYELLNHKTTRALSSIKKDIQEREMIEERKLDDKYKNTGRQELAIAITAVRKSLAGIGGLIDKDILEDAIKIIAKEGLNDA